MLHEVLFYLWKCPGDLFKRPNQQQEWIDMVELREFLHPGEKKLLQRIMYIALDYHRIQEFIKLVIDKQTVQYNVDDNKDLMTKEADTDDMLSIIRSDFQPGLYIKAFCNGVNEVLDDYRHEIIHLESMFLKNPQLTLTFVLGSVEKYVTLFNTLKSIIRIINIEQVQGCLLMGRLYMYIDWGVEPVAKAANKIIRSVNPMFYRHLCNWIIYGDLVDIYNEFFICDGKGPDENFLHSDQLNDNTNTQALCDSFKKMRVKKPPEVRKFYINVQMLPSNIVSIEAAETILFMGRIVWMVRNDPTQNEDEKYQLKFKRDVWEGKDMEYYRKIQALEDRSFNQPEFDATIEECRLRITKYLWSIMVDEAKLLEHLQLIRDYYALGRGELFQQFILTAEEHLKGSPTSYIINNLNFIFAETARKLYGEYDKTYQRFELMLSQFPEKDDPNVWLGLEIKFEIHWPLHIIFHPRALSLYNRLFCFLLRVKKTHMDLHKLWLVHMEGKCRITPGVWTLRNNLIFLVNNLQYYLQVDVIEAHFSLLQKAIKNAGEFEDIIRLHAKFLSNVLSKSFVFVLNESLHNEERKHGLYQAPALNYEENNMVYKAILLLLQLCDEFCMVASTWEGDLTETESLDLEELQKRSDALIETLMRILYSLREKSCGNDLLQLLYRLDFNRWFSKNKPDFNLTLSN